MSMDSPLLPKDEASLCRIINEHVAREESRLSYQRFRRLLAYHFLNGARRFKFDQGFSSFTSDFLDSEGRLEFQSQEIVSAIDRVSAHLSSMDLSPLVAPAVSMTLRGIRQRAVAQVIADGLVSPNQAERAKSDAAHIFTSLGSVGLQLHVSDDPRMGLIGEYEVIHPQELFPFPSLGVDQTKARGLVRQRFVPLAWMEGRYGKALIKARRSRMRLWARTIGSQQDTEHMDGTMVPSGAGAGSVRSSEERAGASPPNVTSAYQHELCLIRELWLDGPVETVSRYVVISGDALIEDQDLSDVVSYCPIGFDRFMQNQSWHGQGVFDLLYSYGREFERLMKSLFSNIYDADRYGFLVMPMGVFNEQTALREVGKGLKVVSYEPEPLAPEQAFKPFAVQPWNTGDAPGKVAAFAKQHMDDINPLKDLVEEKGRIDSAAGLNKLDEAINSSMANSTMSWRRIWGSATRAAVAGALRRQVFNPRPIPVPKLDVDLAGLVIDPTDGTIDLKHNPVPNIQSLRFTVRDGHPRSQAARKQELAEMFAAQLCSPDKFWLTVLKEGLDLTVWHEDYQAAYDSVTENILRVYGDGQQPGQVVLTQAMSRPEFQLIILNAFMASPTMAQADPDVQNAMADYRDTLMQWSGAVLPGNVPNPGEQAQPQQPQQPQMAA